MITLHLAASRRNLQVERDFSRRSTSRVSGFGFRAETPSTGWSSPLAQIGVFREKKGSGRRKIWFFPGIHDFYDLKRLTGGEGIFLILVVVIPDPSVALWSANAHGRKTTASRSTVRDPRHDAKETNLTRKAGRPSSTPSRSPVIKKEVGTKGPCDERSCGGEVLQGFRRRPPKDGPAGTPFSPARCRTRLKEKPARTVIKVRPLKERRASRTVAARQTSPGAARVVRRAPPRLRLRSRCRRKPLPAPHEGRGVECFFPLPRFGEGRGEAG